MLQELTPRAQDSLVSFGERLSTRLFASYLRSQVCRNTLKEGVAQAYRNSCGARNHCTGRGRQTICGQRSCHIVL